MNERIKKVRKKLNLTMEKFGEKLGVGKTAISKVEKGENSVSDQMFRSICREFNVNEEWLRSGTGGDENMFNPAPNNKLKELVSELGLTHKDYIFINKLMKNKELLSTLEDFCISYSQAMNEQDTKSTIVIPTRLISYYYKNASAGTGQIIIDNLPNDTIEIPDIPEYKSVSYAIGVNGSSMEPTYSDGDILLVESTREIQIGQIGIFQLGDKWFVKKRGETELISLNPNYDNIPLDETAITMGRVIDKIHK